MKARLYQILWYVATTTTAAVGITVFSFYDSLIGITIIIGGTGLALLSIWTEIQHALMYENTIPKLLLLYDGVTLFIVAVAFSINIIPSGASTSVRIVAFVFGLGTPTVRICGRPPRS